MFLIHTLLILTFRYHLDFTAILICEVMFKLFLQLPIRLYSAFQCLIDHRSSFCICLNIVGDWIFVWKFLAEIQHQRLVIENSHGEKLVGVLHDTGSIETVVICHGFRSSKVCFFFFFGSILISFHHLQTSFDSHFRFHETLNLYWFSLNTLIFIYIYF